MNRPGSDPRTFLLPLALWVFSPIAAFSQTHPEGGPDGSETRQQVETTLPEEPGDLLLRALRSMEPGSEPGFRHWLEDQEGTGDGNAPGLGLAALDWLQYRYEEAENRLRKLVGPASTDDRVKGYAWLTWGEASQVRGDYARARDHYRRALDLAESAGSVRLQAWSHIRLAGTGARLEGPQAALEHLRAAEPLLDEADSFVRGLFHCSRAGRDPLAGLDPLEDLELGASLALEAGVRRLHAGCLVAQATHYLSRGGSGRALELYHEAQGIQASVGDRAGRAGTLQQAGYVYVTLGSLGWARSYLEQAILEGEASGSYSAVAWALLNLSTISWELGDLPSSLSYLDRAEGIMRDQGDVTGLDVVTGQKGDIAFAAGDLAGARNWLEAALTRYRERGSFRGVFGVQSALMRLALAEGDFEGADEALTRSRETGLSAGMGAWVHSMLHDEGEIALKKGELDRAESAFLRFLEGGQWPPRAYKARVRLAEVMVGKGRMDEAEFHLSEAIGGIERWRTSLDATSIRRYAFQLGEVASDPDLGVATVLAAMAEAGRVTEAFDLAERQRARGLFESMVRADAVRGLSLSEPLAEGEAVPPAPAPRSAVELLEGIPDPHTAVVQFVTGVGGEPTTAFILSDRQVSAVVLPPVDSLRADIDRLNALIRSGAGTASLSERLGTQLALPIVAHLSGSIQKLAIIPDGALHRLPFDLLGLGGGERLLDRYSVALAPSATVLARLWSRDASPGGSRLLALGNPSMPEPGTPVGEDSSAPELRQAREGLRPLPGSAREVRLVARFSRGADVRTGDQATESFLKTSPLADYGVLHFATHAIVDEASVDRTALILAPGGEEDGLVSPGDLARLELAADLVVLSACRTAGGSVIRGEGIQGLTAPFLEAGAGAILATGWEIDDRSGRRFVEDLYRGLAQGSTVGESLRLAKLRAIDRGEPPAQWAAFTLVGDQDVRVDLRVPSRRGAMSLAVLAMVLAVVAVVARASRARRSQSR